MDLAEICVPVAITWFPVICLGVAFQFLFTSKEAHQYSWGVIILLRPLACFWKAFPPSAAFLIFYPFTLFDLHIRGLQGTGSGRNPYPARQMRDKFSDGPGCIGKWGAIFPTSRDGRWEVIFLAGRAGNREMCFPTAGPDRKERKISNIASQSVAAKQRRSFQTGW